MRIPREIEAGKVRAEFKKGVLTITLPKTAEPAADSRKIPVRTE